MSEEEKVNSFKQTNKTIRVKYKKKMDTDEFMEAIYKCDHDSHESYQIQRDNYSRLQR